RHGSTHCRRAISRSQGRHRRAKQLTRHTTVGPMINNYSSKHRRTLRAFVPKIRDAGLRAGALVHRANCFGTILLVGFSCPSLSLWAQTVASFESYVHAPGSDPKEAQAEPHSEVHVVAGANAPSASKPDPARQSAVARQLPTRAMAPPLATSDYVTHVSSNPV